MPIPPSDDPPIYMPPAGSLPPQMVYEGMNRPRFNGCGWAVAIPLGCMGLIAVVVIALAVTGAASFGFFGDTLRSLFAGITLPASARVTSSNTILTGIQPLGQLVTVSVQLAKADVQLNVATGVFNACGFSNDYVAQGTIEAGIDLNAITADDITVDPVTGAVTINAPPPSLTSCRIDYIDKYANSVNVCFNYVDDDEARQLAQHTALLEFRDDAVEGGILDRAQREAQVALGSFVTALTGEATTINFSVPATDATPQPLTPSCVPDVPTRWAYDAATGVYSR